jgi:UDP-2,3-diacylglucosamine pyrophosphatase LpxH
MFEPVEKQNSQYLILSDIHLGSDLVQHARPCTSERLSRVLKVDYDLARMLDYYSSNAGPGWTWTLVIAGDMVDFVSMSITVGGDVELQTPLSDEELEHGLGSAADHGVHKMRAVAGRHSLVFRKLARFIAAGHRLVLVVGNHDIDFYWESVRRAFIDELIAQAALETQEERVVFESRIEFRQWFYYVKGELYVEHGHQYDETCAYQYGLAPLSPYDPQRLCYSFSDILVRYIVRPTPGMTTEGHQEKTVVHYLRMAFSLGFVGFARLGYRFACAIGRMLELWRSQVSKGALRMRAEQEQKIQQIAQRFQIGADKLRNLASLWATPVTGKISSILHTLFLDIVFSAFGFGLLIVLLAAFNVIPFWLMPALAVVGAIAISIWVKSSRVIDPREAIKEGARRVSKLFPARFVVMGHTHDPVMESIGEETTYVNLGNWSTDLLNDDGPEAPCSHLVIRRVQGRLEAELIAAGKMLTRVC